MGMEHLRRRTALAAAWLAVWVASAPMSFAASGGKETNDPGGGV